MWAGLALTLRANCCQNKFMSFTVKPTKITNIKVSELINVENYLFIYFLFLFLFFNFFRGGGGGNKNVK